MTMAPPIITAGPGNSPKINQTHTGVRTVSSKKNMLTSAAGRTRGPLASSTVASGMAMKPLRASQPQAGTP